VSAAAGADLRAEVRAVLTDLVASRGAEGGRPGAMDGQLRVSLAETGFHRLGVPEELGGSGGALSELATMVDVLAYHACQVPVSEEAFIAGWLLSAAGLSVPSGVTVAALTAATGERAGDGLLVTGTVEVPWGRDAEAVALLVRSADETWRVALVNPGAGEVALGNNLADEPRDSLTVSRAEVDPGAHAQVRGVDDGTLLRRGALLRSIQLAAAARSVLDQTLRYVGERVQFGRPLAKFQAVQHQVATMAGEVAGMEMAAASAVLATEAAESTSRLAGEAALAVATAKATTSYAAHVVATIGHQLHGALGYSKEHPLSASTTRLWAWREEFGNEAAWQDRLGGAVYAEGGTWWSSVASGLAADGFDCVTRGRS
jgi:acyl-CoA dehydrogenase